ncbi:MAG TPA: glycosyltransferase [Anaerolineales bacterium]|nr:glycosyltransferase [Anaerolineales bacterium]
MRKLNIIYVIDSLKMGGAERLTASILRNLSDEFSPRVCVFKVKDGNPMAEQIEKLGVPVDLLPIPYLRDVTALPRLTRYLKQVKADLVHGQLEFGSMLGSIAAKWHRLPFVATLHTMSSQKVPMKKKLHGELEFFFLRHFCDTVISVSDEARQFYLEISSLRPSQLVTIYNGVELSHFERRDPRKPYDEIRAQLGVPADAKFLTTVAVLRELKGIQFMIRAMPKILEQLPNAYYLIVGGGKYKDELVREVELAGVGSRVIFAGQRDDVADFLNASDVFVLPTLTEALPTVLAEAMAARLPIIASAVGGIPEMITDGENGILLPPADTEALADACLRLLSDEDAAKSMGDAGWSVANRKFNIRVQVEQLRELYLKLIAASRRNPH